VYHFLGKKAPADGSLSSTSSSSLLGIRGDWYPEKFVEVGGGVYWQQQPWVGKAHGGIRRREFRSIEGLMKKEVEVSGNAEVTEGNMDSASDVDPPEDDPPSMQKNDNVNNDNINNDNINNDNVEYHINLPFLEKICSDCRILLKEAKRAFTLMGRRLFTDDQPELEPAIEEMENPDSDYNYLMNLWRNLGLRIPDLRLVNLLRLQRDAPKMKSIMIEEFPDVFWESAQSPQGPVVSWDGSIVVVNRDLEGM
jgi:hypothetical protein